MPRLLIVALVALLATGTAALGADAPASCRLIAGADTTDTADDVEVCRLDTWVHRAETPAGNLGEVTGTYPSWDTTEPTASYQSGAGGGALGSSVTDVVLGGEPVHGAHWEGTFTGNIDNLAVSVYAIMPNPAAGLGHGLRPFLEIDGMSMWAPEDPVDVATIPVSDGLALVTFAFTNVHKAMETSGLEVGPDVTHDIALTVSPWYWGDDGAYVWDAAEVPSGIIFNVEPKPLRAYTTIPIF